jgi:hypothetical protein
LLTKIKIAQKANTGAHKLRSVYQWVREKAEVEVKARVVVWVENKVEIVNND